MHAPDGLLNVGTALATGALSAGTIGATLRRARGRIDDRRLPLAGLVAAFVFAAQMINFPVAAGTTGHLVGGALAAVLVGPGVAVLVMTVVVGVQALVFADGGLTALGYNLLNLAIVPTLGGYAVFRWIRRLLPRTHGGVVAASGLAAATSVILGAMAFSIEWLFGATAPVPFDTVFAAMVGVHALIAVGEGVISGTIVAAVLAARPDLVNGAAGARSKRKGDEQPRVRFRTFLLAGLLTALVLGAVVSQFAADAPDGLERVAADTGITREPATSGAGGVFADYATEGIDNEALSLAVAGAAGVALTLALAGGIAYAMRERRHGSGQAAA